MADPDRPNLPVIPPASRSARAYKFQKILGDGGQGVVWEVYVPEYNSCVAVKVAKWPRDEVGQYRLADEADILKQIRAYENKHHGYKHIVRYIAQGILEDSKACLVMERIEGKRLSDYLVPDARLPWRGTFRLMAGAARALELVHDELGRIHGDFKPENLVITTDGIVKLLDFGQCRAVSQDNNSIANRLLRWTGYCLRWLGRKNRSVPYGIRLAGNRYADPWEDSTFPGDIYSLGAVLYRCLTGEFITETRGFYEVTGSLLRKGWHEGYDFPLQVVSLLEKCLQRPDFRPTARELAEELAAIASNEEYYTLITNSRKPSYRTFRPLLIIGTVIVALLIAAFWALDSRPKQTSGQIGDGSIPSVNKDLVSKTGGEVPPPPGSLAQDLKAAEYVLSIGGTICINNEITAPSIPLPKEFKLTYVELSKNGKIDDDGLKVFKGCLYLKHLGLGRTSVGDEGVAYFSGISSLTNLNLFGTKVTDKGLASFKMCKDLDTLQLGETDITDSGLIYLQNCTQLANVSFEFSKLIGPGLVQFENQKNLRFLNLHNLPVTDDDLKFFYKCESLRRINLIGTKVSAKGLDELKKALPACEIAWPNDGDLYPKDKEASLPIEKTDNPLPVEKKKTDSPPEIKDKDPGPEIPLDRPEVVEKPKEKPINKIDALKQALKDKNIQPLPESTLAAIAKITPNNLTDNRYTDKPGMLCSSGGFFKTVGGYDLYLSSEAKAPFVFQLPVKPKYVIFFPADGTPPTLIPKAIYTNGDRVAADRPGTYAVPSR
ncbi:protein kinase domain-containing protein [Fimbriiglobus ruber]|uniref:Alanyl-tRNA synthetase n=1 Tax=Fimbriiglobus ruber TaxID=1908690 RepID=A0A225DBH6_9BACT|nr:protein kinase [Fimbriiglobus ruber]OWK38940.1 Alanyl-tRNA synthetase [Fimbriiglobus ruber]OWK38974.1 Alanyl-tRNA synthetase [Fimbriiglobus ruber]